MRNVVPKNAMLVPKDATCVFKGIIFDTYQWQQKMYDGSFKTFEMLKRPDTLKVIAIKDNKIVIVEQEQPGHEVFYDLPGGRNDNASENELEGTKRELLEETGLTFRSWKLIDVTQPGAKIEHFVYVFLATDFENQVAQELDNGERIQLKYMDFDAVKKLIGDPKTRYLPKAIFDKVNSLDELVQLPEYT